MPNFYCGQRSLFLVQNSKIGGCSAASAGEGRDDTALVPLDNTCGKRDESWLLLTGRNSLPTPTARGRLAGEGKWPVVVALFSKLFGAPSSRVCALAVLRQRVAWLAPCISQRPPSYLRLLLRIISKIAGTRRWPMIHGSSDSCLVLYFSLCGSLRFCTCCCVSNWNG